MSDHARFQVKGVITRVFVAKTGNFARVTVEVQGERTKKVDVVAFKGNVAQFGKLGEGEEVTISGDVAMEKITDKAKNEVKIDGYSRWVPMLVADKVVAVARKEPPGDIPFGNPSDSGW